MFQKPITRVIREVNIFVVCLIVSFLLLGLCSYKAQAQVICDFTQVTENPRSIISRLNISPQGNHIAFESLDDITGSNNDNDQEVFLFDTTNSSTTQITITSGFNGLPSMNFDATLIALQSPNDLDPGSNPDGNFEIFLFDRIAGSFTQITDTSGTFLANIGPSISSDGTRIAFTSRRDLVPFSNVDLNKEVFVFDVVGMNFTQITHTTGDGPGDNIPSSISSDGSRILFRSSIDIIPPGNDDGNTEFFLFDETTPIVQITDTAVNVLGARLSSDGTTIVLISNDDIVSGENSDNGREVFLYDIATMMFTQITNTNDSNGNNFNASINADGTRIAFYSKIDHSGTGKNVDENIELFVYETDSMFFTQVTDTTGGGIPGNPSPTDMNAEGNRIVFESDRDLTGDNFADGEALIFFADCVPDSDNDGVPDSEDLCMDSDLSTTVIIDGCDSGVNNILDEDGCTISDSINEIAEDASNHGKFVSGVAKLLNSLKKQGIITGGEKGAVQSCASQADIP